MKKIISYSNVNLKWLCTFILFISCILLSVILNVESYIYDSNYYWTVADGVFSEGTIDIRRFPETFRGCILPIIISASKIIFNGIWGWRIISSLMVAFLFGIFLPKIMGYSINNMKNFIRVIICEYLFFIFWGDFLQYPLSDLPAVFFFVAGIYFLISILETSNERNISNKKMYISNFRGGCALEQVCI